MAHFMLQSRLSLGGTDFAGHVASMNATHTQKDIDDTVFGDTFENCIAGLQRYEQAITLRDDLTDNEVDEDIFALWSSNGSLAVEWGFLQSFTEAANNPEYQYTAMLLSCQSGGGVGEGASLQLQLRLASGSVTRDVT
jgi:hypothetical protein